jgi:hypothetical protein
MPQAYGKVNRLLPTPQAENAQVQARSGQYGELYSVPLGFGLYPLAIEGTYFKAINPTPGTGLATSIQTSFSSTNGVLAISNGGSGSAPHLILDYLRLIYTVVGTSTALTAGVVAIDNTIRYSSGGTAITALNGCNMDVASSSVATLHVGALTLGAASGSVRYLSRFNLRTAIMVQYEEQVISFGRPSAGDYNVLSGTSAQRMVTDAGPVVLGAGSSACIHLWNVGNATTAPSVEFELGWIER